MRVLLFGASIVQGLWDPQGGWGRYLRTYLDEKTLDDSTDEKYQTFNLGVSGQDSSHLLDRIEDEIKARDRENRELLIIVNIGGNDSLYMNERDEMRVPRQEFRENLRDILDISNQYARDVVFVGDIPFNYSILDPLPWSTHESLREEDRQDYIDITRQICSERDVSFISVRENVDEKEFTENLVDGIHPGTEGHRRIFETVKHHLIREDIICRS